MTRSKGNTRFCALVGMVLLLYGCAIPTKRSTVTFLLPEGFQGSVVVLYGQEAGSDPRVEDDSYVFDVPENGVLRVTANASEVPGQPRFLYVDGTGSRREIEVLVAFDPTGVKRTSRDISDEERAKTVFVFAFEHGSFKTSQGDVQFANFIVGHDIDGNYQYTQMQKKLTELQRSLSISAH